MSAVAEILQSSDEMQFSSLLKHAPVGLALCPGPGNVTSRNSVFDELLGLLSSQIPCALLELIRDGAGSPATHLRSISGKAGKLPNRMRGVGSRKQVAALDGLGSSCRRLPARECGRDVRGYLRRRTGQAAIAAGRAARDGWPFGGGSRARFQQCVDRSFVVLRSADVCAGPSDRARKYAEEIRKAGLQATGLVRQLLTMVRSNKSSPRPVSLNEVAEGMRNLLVRLIGENIELKLKLDSNLELVKMDPVQAQQVLLNLVLNARDALPCGGHISVETGNCKMQILSSTGEQNPETTCVPSADADRKRAIRLCEGSFYGANQSKDGLMAMGEGGTIFLDEVGELSVDLQAKMLRAIQEKEIRPVGSTRRVPINVRILAATNRDLEQAVTQGSFRRDLYFRLNVLSLRIPPLRERRQDIPLLIGYFLDRMTRSSGQEKVLSDEALKAMLAYDWPGNVRELENCLERSCAFTSGPAIHTNDLPREIANLSAAEPSNGNGSGHLKIVPIAELEKQTILNAITELNGDKLQAARLLGIGKTTLYRKLKDYATQG